MIPFSQSSCASLELLQICSHLHTHTHTRNPPAHESAEGLKIRCTNIPTILMLPSNRKANMQRLSQPQDFRAALIQDVKAGLSTKPWSFPCKYRYNDEGSRLCERITETPQYYLRRAEIEILMEKATEIMEIVNPEEMVELGSGYSTKTKILIEAMKNTTQCRVYSPFDISEDAIRKAAEQLTAEYDWLEVNGQLGDFDTDIVKLERRGRRLMVFLGSSIGNLASKAERNILLSNIAAAMLPGDALLLGIDLVKDPSVILSAYQDTEGLNKRFKLQTLSVINHELDGNFPLNDFEYKPVWDAERFAVVSKLQAQRKMKVSLNAIPVEIEFSKGDEIITGISHKFTSNQITEEIAATGLKVSSWYTDNSALFGLLIATM